MHIYGIGISDVPKHCSLDQKVARITKVLGLANTLDPSGSAFSTEWNMPNAHALNFALMTAAPTFANFRMQTYIVFVFPLVFPFFRSGDGIT